MPSAPARLPRPYSPQAPVTPGDRLDAASLEHLVLVCLEGLANRAEADGQRHRATRLAEAAGFLRRTDRPSSTEELTRREWEVAALVARGYSNRQIAAELVVSGRTVDTHVSHILHKLGLLSRAHIAAWVVAHQPRLTVLV
jgi:non-specific serine/threonine protein kinase